MLLRMEREMTKGMSDQIPSNALDTMLNEISQISTDMIVARKNAVAAHQKMTEEEKKQSKEALQP